MKKSLIALVTGFAILGAGCSAAPEETSADAAVETVATPSVDLSERQRQQASRDMYRYDMEEEMRILKEIEVYDVTVAYRGDDPVPLRLLKGKTVADALEKGEFAIEEADTVSVEMTDKIADDMEIVVTNETTKTWEADWKIEQPETVYVNDNSIAKGDSKVIQDGRSGVEKVTLSAKVVNGVEGDTEVIDREVTREAVAKKVAVGTYVAPAPATQAPKQQQQKKAPSAPAPAPSKGGNSGAGLNLANEAMWDRIAQCESSGNWSINTGNGYYGGLQFDYNTWLSVNGDDFAPRADLATRAQQITVANRLYAQRGLQPWGCAHAA